LKVIKIEMKPQIGIVHTFDDAQGIANVV